METKPRLMPLLPLRGMLVFPGMIINLDVGRERSIHAVEAAMTSDKQILLSGITEGSRNDGTRAEGFI